jgi:RNA polymerase sigma factor (sigma-70 family)
MLATPRNPDFPTTHWTLVEIVQGGDQKRAASALEDICANYWYPVYAYLRRSGKDSQDAEDLTQTLFHKLLADESLQEVRQERGRLRNFLIGMVRRIISNQDRHDEALKRGGGEPVLSLDEALADGRYAQEPPDMHDPEHLYDRAWAMQLLESVRHKLKDAFTKTGRVADYGALEPYLDWTESPAPYAELAAHLNSNEKAVRVLVHRLRKKFRELLEAEISKTVVNPEDIAEELAWMRRVLG